MKVIELDGDEAALVFQGDDVTIELPDNLPDPVPPSIQTAVALYAMMNDEEFIAHVANEWKEMLKAAEDDK